MFKFKKTPNSMILPLGSLSGLILVYIFTLVTIIVSGYSIGIHTTTTIMSDDNTVSELENLKVIGNLTVNDVVNIENEFQSQSLTTNNEQTNELNTQTFVVASTSLTSAIVLSMKLKTQYMSLFLTQNLVKTFDFSDNNFNVDFPFGSVMTLSNCAVIGTAIDHFALESQSEPNFNGTFAIFSDPGIWFMTCSMFIQWGLNSGIFVTPVSADLLIVAVDESIDSTASRNTSILSMLPTQVSQSFYCFETIVFQTPMLNSSNNIAKFIGLALPITYDPIQSNHKIGQITITSLNVTFRRLQ
jgi:hypothetical protein